MAKILIENTREHDITVNVPGGAGEVVQVTVPAARQNPEDKSELINGRAEVDDSIIEAGRQNPVVAHYFEEGWLRVVVSKPAAKPAADKKTAAKE